MVWYNGWRSAAGIRVKKDNGHLSGNDSLEIRHRKVAMEQETTILSISPVEMERKMAISQISDQDLLISTWLRTKGKKTQLAYRQDIARLRKWIFRGVRKK
jgi:hypothetical protein